jgi:hypothetical protein
MQLSVIKNSITQIKSNVARLVDPRSAFRYHRLGSEEVDFLSCNTDLVSEGL